jgi:hypothetical protein
MGECHAVIADELLDRIETDPELSRLITVVDKKPHADPYTFFDTRGRTHAVSATHRAHLKTEALPEGYHFDLNLIIEDDGTIRFKRDVDV